MAAIIVAEFEATGSESTRWFHAFVDGKIGQADSGLVTTGLGVGLGVGFGVGLGVALAAGAVAAGAGAVVLPGAGLFVGAGLPATLVPGDTMTGEPSVSSPRLAEGLRPLGDRAG